MIALSKRLVVLLVALAVLANATCFAACVANHCEEVRKEVAATCHQSAPDPASHHPQDNESDARCQHFNLWSDRDRGPVIGTDSEFVAMAESSFLQLSPELVVSPASLVVVSPPLAVSSQRSSVLRI
jgi:hypothetical protein